jgi:glycosyltransferase involved in cell wall biosynthesis
MKTKKTKVINVLFIVPAPLGVSPGQRFRFEHYLAFLKQRDIEYTVRPYYSLKGRKMLYSTSNTFAKGISLLGGYLRRLSDVFIARRYDYIYIHREDVPLGLPIFAWVVSKILKKKIIYDFDDAIWIPAMSDYNQKFSFLKCFSNVSKICRWAHIVSVGNSYLQEYARGFAKNVVVIPTVVNTDTVHGVVQDQDTDFPAIGWTGSFSTLTYLRIVLPVLQELQEEIDFTFYVIADRDPRLQLRNYKFVKWSAETESADLLRFHIGLMPLSDDKYSQGKCGFKAIQYMALGMPAIVSPVGVNKKIVDNAKNGFICSSKEEWKQAIKQLLKDRSLRKKMGAAARVKIENNYSINATKELFLNLFSSTKTTELPLVRSMETTKAIIGVITFVFSIL